jgi:ribonuclease HI
MTTLLMYCDGGSRSNPGPAGIGVVGIVEEDGERTCILEKSLYLKDRSNNYAEYTAFIYALDYITQVNYNDVTIHSDSKLIIEQLTGNWKVKSPDLAILYGITMKKINKLRSLGVALTLKWIPREQNRHADALANLAMDRQLPPEAIDPERIGIVDQRLMHALVAHEEAIKELKEEPRVNKISRIEETFEEVVDSWANLRT